MTADRPSRWRDAYDLALGRLIAARGDRPYWLGRLADSALATATAAAALHLADPDGYAESVDRALAWLRRTRNDDGAWGDTPDSPSNPSCTALVLAAQRIAHHPPDPVGRTWLESTGGMGAIAGRYGADRTFSVPILTQAALAEMVDWADVPALPFELAALPRWTFRLGPMPVVSYALPALIAIGLLRHVKRPSASPIVRLVRRGVTERVLRRLEAIQPSSGGFLEATPLTSFVAMSLIASGQADHPVTERAIGFLIKAQRAGGAWPIDENLSIWNTTMAVAALDGGEGATRDWLIAHQHQRVHPYTAAAPGGWGWSHLPGSVPDVDDTAGALVALGTLPPCNEARQAALAGARWLVSLQNRDGGFPTFCRGWGKLEFDRSAPDLTAHALQALHRWRHATGARLRRAIDRALRRGLRYLARTQCPDGSWLALWFGSQRTAEQTNPVFGTARVVAALAAMDETEHPMAVAGRDYMIRAAGAPGGWAADGKAKPTIEETAVAVDALMRTGLTPDDAPVTGGLNWLSRRILAGGLREPSPIGLYFARLWYHERLYPVTLAVGALRRALGPPTML
ncbi:MAG: squalene--hopene cyclase [Planctomycetota bacterium]